MVEEEPEVYSYLSTSLLAVGQPRRAIMAGITRHDNQKSQLSFDVAITEQSAPLYENGKPIPRRETRSGRSVAVLGSAI